MSSKAEKVITTILSEAKPQPRKTVKGKTKPKAASMPEYQYEMVDREESDALDDLAYAITKMVGDGCRYFYSKWTGQDQVDMIIASKSPLDGAAIDRVFDDAMSSVGSEGEGEGDE